MWAYTELQCGCHEPTRGAQRRLCCQFGPVVLIGRESSRARGSFRWRAGVSEYDRKCRRVYNCSAELASTPVARNAGCAVSLVHQGLLCGPPHSSWVDGYRLFACDDQLDEWEALTNKASSRPTQVGVRHARGERDKGTDSTALRRSDWTCGRGRCDEVMGTQRGWSRAQLRGVRCAVTIAPCKL